VLVAHTKGFSHLLKPAKMEGSAAMRVLLSVDDLGRWSPGHDGALDRAGLAAAYAYPQLGAGATWVRANFISTLDGAANGDDGRSGSINTGADREVFALLRALCDVILVGAGTARTEGYKRATIGARWASLRQDRPDHPSTAIFSRSGQVPPTLSAARNNSGEVLLVTCQHAGDQAIEAAQATLGKANVIVDGQETVDLASVMARLAARGLQRVLCEGGPHLLGDLTAAGHLDELCLSIAPTVVAGDHPRIAAGAPVTANLTPRLLIQAQDTILGRWVRPNPDAERRRQT
jgi:riboflavin biosynthesis pyrimidine reductase